MAAPVPAYPTFPTRPTPARLNELFAVQRAADPLGTRVHTIAAAVACFLAGFPTTVIEWAALPLLVCFAIRMFTHHRVLGPLVWDWPSRLTFAFIAWMGLSALWTYGGSTNWIQDGQSLRFALVIPTIYPVLDRRRTLVLALTLGLMCGQLSQLVHLVSQQLGHTLFHRDPQRISGWWDPVMAGSLLCACLGLVLGRFRLDAPRPYAWMIALVSTLAAIAITGTRGAWIAAALLLGAFAVILLRTTISTPGSRHRAMPMLIALTLAIVLASIGVVTVRPIRARLDRAITEVRAAVTTRNYSSDTGLRIAMAKWAWIEFASHPLRGVGAGGYQPFAAARCTSSPPPSPGEDERPLRNKKKRPPTAPARPFDPVTQLPLPHAHAHSWFPHTLATLGLPGLLLLLATLAAALRPLWSRMDVDRSAYAAALGLLGLTLAGLFDTIHVNQQTAYVLFLLLALLNTMRPNEPRTQ